MAHGRLVGDGHDIRVYIPTIEDIGQENWDTLVSYGTQYRVSRLDFYKRIIAEVSKKERDRLNRDAHPEGEDRGQHSHPAIRRHHFRLVNRIRRYGLRNAEILTTLNGLDPSNDIHFRWYYHHRTNFFSVPSNDRYYDPQASAWNLEIPWSTPEGIPQGEISDVERVEWSVTNWAVEKAAMLELEEVYGGSATMHFRGHANMASRDEWTAGENRVLQYLLANYRDTPEDPYDPNLWGHDARLESLALSFGGGAPPEIKPAFDPDIYEYTVESDGTRTIFYNAQPLDEHLSRDNISLMVFGDGGTRTTDRLEITVTAADGETKKVYTIQTVSPPE